eukprot:CAMPEP_0202510484 /NCGR_PEP_ID=MMETSP1361-20130828/53318_1 /ASSEMBLY_ACC=CAM_ASM_000849 /TAXON_ID=210615 /ORGANISM="Staurosira complex sp., Strain CCMP2646" /LENGTH=551 /DNA_ID=CAMNT_0049144749 /DNA_START=721 /DNA_END=2376 /DNA_ORIENTATION=+
MERISTTNNSGKVASLPGNHQAQCERERMLSLLCQEELSSSNAATASTKRTDDQSRSSSSADASVMEYSLAANMSEEISRLIFSGERCGGVRPRRNWREVKRQKSDEDKKPPSLPLAPDKPLTQPIFPEIPQGKNLPMPINISPKFVFLRPVSPDYQGRLFKALIEQNASQSGSPSIFRRNTVTPTDADKMVAVQDSKKRKASQSPGAADTDTKLQLRSPAPSLPRGAQVGDIVDTATKMLSAMRATSSASGSTCTAQASIRSTSSTFTSMSGRPQGQSSMWPNNQYPQSPIDTQLTQDQSQDLEKLQLTPMSHYMQQQEPSTDNEKGLFDDVFADEQDDALPDCSLDLMNVKDLEPDTSVYMCSRDPNGSSDIPTEISTENLERQPSRQVPWFPTGTRQVMASQSSSALYFGDRNGGVPLANNNNNLLNLQQPQQPRPSLANNEESTTYYGRKTRAPLIDDDEPEEEIKINLEEFFDQVERQSRASSSPEREMSSLFTNPPPPSPRHQWVRMARTESITDGDADIGGLLSHQLLPSPKHANKHLRHSSSM